MNALEYAVQNYNLAVSREEFGKYATGNPYAEVEAEHARQVSNLVNQIWQKHFGQQAPVALTIAGLYHDFDRVFPPEHSNDSGIKTNRRAIDTKSLPDCDYLSSEEKFRVHPQNCAAIFRDYNPSISPKLQNDISYLIERHEVGGDKNDSHQLIQKTDSFSKSYDLNIAADVLCEADALVFFSLIIYSYGKDRPIERVREKIKFSYNKLSDVGKKLALEFDYQPIETVDGETIDTKKLVLDTVSNI